MSIGASEETVRPAAGVWASVLFEETQFFHPLVYFALLLGTPIALAGVWLADPEEIATVSPYVFAWVAAIDAFILNLLVLRTRVEAGEVHVALGWVPLFWTRLGIGAITEARPVTYRPLRDAGGWGFRFGRFEGNRCRFWNARGDRGVFLRCADRCYIIGSQRPEELYRALAAGGVGNGGRGTP